jgi:hypothetical protein
MCSVIVKTKNCKKCNVELIVGENIAPSMFKNSDFKCKECKKQLNKKWVKDNAEYSTQYRKTERSRSSRIKFQHSIPPGVYEILYKGIRKYVGQSKQPYHRIVRHFSKYSNLEDAYSMSPVCYKLTIGEIQREDLSFNILEFEDDKQRREEIEQRYIDESTGLWNVVGQRDYYQ